MSELLSCPFCGGEASVLRMDYGYGSTVWGVFCVNDSDDSFSHGHFIDNYATEAEAIDAWNTRAVESASGLVYIPSFRDNGEFPEHIWASLGGEAVAYFRERTCHMEGDGCFPPNCSACGWQADTYDCAWLEDGRYEYDGKFCKQCGAKVVSE